MKKRVSIFLLVLIIVINLAVGVSAEEFDVSSRFFQEEDTTEYPNETVNTFDFDIEEVMATSDSFVDKVASVENFDVYCRNAILIEETTGQVLYQKKPDEKVAIASITKVMTMLLVMEALQANKFTLNDTVPISNHAFSMGGSQIWVEPGEIFTVNELLKATAVSSANDAAVALAEFVGGSEEAFCQMMNDKAKELKMENTHFMNACGLDLEGHYSTAHDVSVMARELMKHKEIYNYTSIWMDYLRNGKTQIVNTNKLLQSYPGITGLKTGTTSKAGICITATAQRDGLSLIAVVLGSGNSQDRFSSAKKILDFGFSNFETKSFPNIDGMPKEIPVKFSVDKTATIKVDVPQNLLFVKGSTTELSYKIEIPESINAPMYSGMKVGNVSLYTESGKIREYDITLSQDVVRIDFNKALALLTKYIGIM